MGRKKYVYVPPKAPDEHSFSRVARTALLAKVPGQANWGLMLAGLGAVGAAACILRGLFGDFVIYACAGLVALIGLGGIGISMQLERARGIHTDEAVDGVRAVLRILIVFALTTPFWSLFDQKASTWIVQANSMATFGINLFGTNYTFLPAQLQALNPLFVMLLIPFNNLVLYPLLERFGLLPTPLRRMTAGIAFSGLSWIVIGTLQVMLDRGDAVSMAWQILPYALLTFGEVLVSATGLEFAYSQAPASMKGVIMSLWYLSVTIGNLWVLLVNNSVKNPAVIETIRASGYGAEAFQMYFFAAFALLAALVFGLYARRYKMTDNYRTT
jgi:POT family proton-dependent oligopeptide transporter